MHKLTVVSHVMYISIQTMASLIMSPAGENIQEVLLCEQDDDNLPINQLATGI